MKQVNVSTPMWQKQLFRYLYIPSLQNIKDVMPFHIAFPFENPRVQLDVQTILMNFVIIRRQYIRHIWRENW